MTAEKQTSTARVKAHLARKKERKQLLASKGLMEVPLIVKIDQVFTIENAAKMTRRRAPELLYSITQPAICQLCQKHDEILANNAQVRMEKVLAWIEENPELIEEALKNEEANK